MGRIKDLTGKKFGNLTVLNDTGKRGKSYNVIWNCLCDCGNEHEVNSGNLRSGMVKSCGCLNHKATNKSHGMYKTPTYNSWVSMKVRCNRKKNDNYHRYGGRGIKVCERWMVFENFFADMGERPEGMTLDRIDNDGNYEQSNCKWSTKQEQRINQNDIRIRDEKTGRYKSIHISESNTN